MNIYSKTKENNQANKRNIYKFLRDLTSNLDYGYKYKGNPIHCNPNKQIEEFLSRKRNYLNRMTNKMFDDHFSGEKTFYFTGSSLNDETLVMIDIDCHDGIGNLQEAIKFANHIKKDFFHNLYYEPSTNGKGIHGYFILVKGQIPAYQVNEYLGMLEDALDKFAQANGYNLSAVEIKGRIPVVNFNNGLEFKAGTLAKFPRNPNFHQADTTKLTFAELDNLICEIEGLETEVEIKKPVAVRNINKSCTGKLIDMDNYEKCFITASHLLNGQVLKTSSRAVVNAHHLAIFLLITSFCSKNMNDDGSLPTDRIITLWDAIYQAGDVDNACDPRRIKVMRDYLSALNLIDWQDNTFFAGETRDKGQNRIKGQAMKWQLEEEFIEQLNNNCDTEEERTSFVVTEYNQLPNYTTPYRDLDKELHLHLSIWGDNWTDSIPILEEMFETCV